MDTSQELIRLAQEIFHEVEVLFLRLRNVTGSLDAGEYAEYLGSFDRIQRLFDKFSYDFRDAGFPDSPELREARGELSNSFREFSQARTKFQSAVKSAEPALENTPEETEEADDEAESVQDETVSDILEEADAPEEPKKKRQKKRRIRKPSADRAIQEERRAEAARMGMQVQPGQPITEADLQSARIRLEEERQRKAEASAEAIRRENENLSAYQERMAQSAEFQHLESSHLDMSREGIGHTNTESDSEEYPPAAIAFAAVSQEEVRQQEPKSGDRRDREEHRENEQRRESEGSRSTSHTEAAHPRKQYHLSKIATNLGAVTYVAFSAAAMKTIREASKDSDTVSGLLEASYYVPTAAGLAWSLNHNPTKPLKKGQILPDDLSRRCSDARQRYRQLKVRTADLEKQLAAFPDTNKLSHRRREQLQLQLTALKSQLPAAERAAAQSRRLQRFQHERNLDRELLTRLKVKGKMPHGYKALGERSQAILQEDNRQLIRKYGSLAGLSEKDIRARVLRLRTEGRALKVRIHQMESKPLSPADRQLLKRLKDRCAAIGKEISFLMGLSRARTDLAYRGAKLRAIQNTAGKRYTYRLSGIRLVRYFALTPLYRDSNTEGLGVMAQIVSDSTVRHIAAKTVAFPFRLTGKVVRRTAPKFAFQCHQIKQEGKAFIHSIVTAPKRGITRAVGYTADRVRKAMPTGIKKRVNSSIRFLRKKYNTARTVYGGARKWLAGSRVGRAWTQVRIFGQRLSAAWRLVLGTLKKGVLAGLGIFLGIVLLIGIIGMIVPTAATSSSVIMSPAPSSSDKINLAPYCQVIRTENARFQEEISRLIDRYENDARYEKAEMRFSGASNNMREMLSMMAVRLQQSLDIDDNPDVRQYLVYLFRASHTYTVSEHSYTCSGCQKRPIQVVEIDPETGEATVVLKEERYCPGHKDVTIQVRALTFDELFGCDTYTIPHDGWEGWTEDNISWCKMIYDMDWTELYEGVSIGGGPAFGTVATSEETRRIWNYLYSFIGNPYGTAGLMGNLCAESALRPNNLQDQYEALLGYDDITYTQAVDDGSYDNFVGDSAGYGLAQWTYYARKQNLYDFAQAQGKSIGDLDLQLQFLSRELTGTSILAVLRSATSVREASDVVLLQFEAPLDQSEKVQLVRARLGELYYNSFVLGTQAEGQLTQKQRKVIEIATNSDSYGIPANPGYCQAWAAYVYGAAGLPIDGSSCAYQSGVRYGVSNDWSIVPPGAAVYGYSGSQYGHVGIYVGNGLVYHNIGGVAVDTLSDWIRKYDGFCWGWEAGSDLTQYD